MARPAPLEADASTRHEPTQPTTPYPRSSEHNPGFTPTQRSSRRKRARPMSGPGPLAFPPRCARGDSLHDELLVVRLLAVDQVAREVHAAPHGRAAVVAAVPHGPERARGRVLVDERAHQPTARRED